MQAGGGMLPAALVVLLLASTSGRANSYQAEESWLEASPLRVLLQQGSDGFVPYANTYLLGRDFVELTNTTSAASCGASCEELGGSSCNLYSWCGSTSGCPAFDFGDATGLATLPFGACLLSYAGDNSSVAYIIAVSRWTAGKSVEVETVEPFTPTEDYLPLNYTTQDNTLYLGPSLLSRTRLPTEDSCIAKCSVTADCKLWAYCPSDAASGCPVEAFGQYDAAVLPATTCLLSYDSTPGRWATLVEAGDGVSWSAGYYYSEDTPGGSPLPGASPGASPQPGLSPGASPSPQSSPDPLAPLAPGQSPSQLPPEGDYPSPGVPPASPTLSPALPASPIPSPALPVASPSPAAPVETPSPALPVVSPSPAAPVVVPSPVVPVPAPSPDVPVPIGSPVPTPLPSPLPPAPLPDSPLPATPSPEVPVPVPSPATPTPTPTPTPSPTIIPSPPGGTVPPTDAGTPPGYDDGGTDYGGDTADYDTVDYGP